MTYNIIVYYVESRITITVVSRILETHACQELPAEGENS